MDNLNLRPVGIIGAMEIEVSEIKEQLSEVKVTRHIMTDFYEGYLNGVKVVVAKCGVGKVNSAICASVMSLLFNPYVIINPGVAGGVGKGVLIGDLVIASSCVEHDMDTSLAGDPVSMVNLGNESLINIPCSEKYSKIFLEEAKNIYNGNVFYNVIVSGDQFIADPVKVMSFKENYDAFACDMESASIAHTCYMAGIPFVALRSISDNANESGSVDYFEFAKKSAKKTMELLSKCISLICE